MLEMRSFLHKVRCQLLNKFEGSKGNKGKKWQQFVTILHLLQEVWPLLEYDSKTSLLFFGCPHVAQKPLE
jgi:hypothetical protein